MNRDFDYNFEKYNNQELTPEEIKVFNEFIEKRIKEKLKERRRNQIKNKGTKKVQVLNKKK